MADGPKVKSASLFETRDSTTDVTFVVEDTPLYFCRALLVVSSSVFSRMFSADFKEKESETIPLPGKSYADFVTFLMQLHPAHSWFPLSGKYWNRPTRGIQWDSLHWGVPCSLCLTLHPPIALTGSTPQLSVGLNKKLFKVKIYALQCV